MSEVKQGTKKKRKIFFFLFVCCCCCCCCCIIKSLSLSFSRFFLTYFFFFSSFPFPFSFFLFLFVHDNTHTLTHSALAGETSQKLALSTKKKLEMIESKLVKARLSGGADGGHVVMELEMEKKRLEDIMLEQLQDGHVAATAAEEIRKVSEGALAKVVEGERRRESGEERGGEERVEEEMNEKKKAQDLSKETEKMLCVTAKKVLHDLGTKLKTLDALALSLYNEMEHQQQGWCLFLGSSRRRIDKYFFFSASSHCTTLLFLFLLLLLCNTKHIRYITRGCKFSTDGL